MWALCVVAFAGAVAIPLPGTTTALLFVLRSDLFALSAAVVGAAVGGTLGAALLLALGQTGRRVLRRRSERSRYKRWALSCSQRFANRWSYAAVFLLLIPFVIPRAVVLLAAVLARLKARPFLVAVFFGTLVREAAYAALFVYIW